jgi:hypothetical protein
MRPSGKIAAAGFPPGRGTAVMAKILVAQLDCPLRDQEKPCPNIRFFGKIWLIHPYKYGYLSLQNIYCF